MMNEKLNETSKTEDDVTINAEAKPDGKLDETPKKSSWRARKKLKREQTDGEETPKKTLWVQLKILPIWLRLILIILLLAIVIVIGLRFGYGYIGDGDPAEVLKKDTWMHIIDIIQGKE